MNHDIITLVRDLQACVMNRAALTRSSRVQQIEKELLFGNTYSRLPILLDVAHEMDTCDWLALLGREWTGFDNVGVFLDDLLDTPFGWVLGDGPIVEMMNAEELAAYDALPNPIAVYRGCYVNNKWGICWSLNRTTAEEFPTLNRYRQKGQPLLVRAEAKKQHVAAIKLDRGEAEIITFRPKHISTTYIQSESALA